MESIAIGEIITLEDQREFICFQKICDGGKDYLFLVSNFKPVEVIIAEEVLDEDGLRIQMLADPELKQRLVQMFKETAAKKPEPPKQTQAPDKPIPVKLISAGDTVTLEGGAEYICARKIRDGDKEYLLLSSKKNFRSVLFAEETVSDGSLSIRIVRDPELLSRLEQQVRKNPWESFKQMWHSRKK